MKLDGIHHIAVVTADADKALGFYAEVLGLGRIIEYPTPDGRRTVLGGALGPGGETLVLEEPHRAAPRRLGRGSLHRIGWWVPDVAALHFWSARLFAAGAAPRTTRPSFGAVRSGWRPARGLRFESPEGTAHELVAWAGRAELPPPLAAHPHVPGRYALRGFAGVRAFGADRVASGDLLAGRLGFAAAGGGVYAVAGRHRSAEYAYDDPPREREVLGVGSIAHVAWGCDGRHLRAWRQRVIGHGARLEPPTPTPWFSSIRFREPAGPVFEIATR
jgi:glyoxalase family protein